MVTQRFQVGDLVQIKSEYLEGGNPSLFRIREIVGDEALLGQLSSTQDGFHGADTSIRLDDPDLIAPYPEILQRYARHLTAADDIANSTYILSGVNQLEEHLRVQRPDGAS
ncbi:hypothetical protein [Mycobacteroides chelonae]|uniref:Uncharacterized protein n=1 Tax=Mycobacteroides chelonae TaxID=1774 RepID=A0A1S1LYE8_MYCCH|nr:hypothetical protein [Mycobacteroides chelonae]OHU76126.1 hypothetical protein BKG84_24860 [Mycobacteroides chelonae]